MVEIRPVASDIHTGGGNVSISMLSTWWRCPRLFYWQYVHEWPAGQRGVEPRYTRDYLLIGSAVHSGLAAWYMSGWKDGQYQLDAALAAVRAHLDTRVDESPSEDEHAAVVAESERLLRNYATEYGPTAKSPEWPTFRIAADNDGNPMVERTFTHTLRTGHTLTVRPDLIAYNFDSLVACEHKVPAAQSVTRTIGEARLGGQGLAQEAILQGFDIPTNGQLINVIVRGRVAKTRPFQREVIAHDPWAVAQLLQLASDTVRDIQATTERWAQLVDDGFSGVDAARVAFPMVGTLSGHCVGKFGPCTAFDLCSSSGREQSMLQGFRARTYHADVPATE